ncbi:hypothetical protein K435DRAFT_190822 [Dendrothele bispora CBS 962.96]|uniref:SnoaL-like domain-containing protein n=1 Tax=Dendrothele bispora (strain CBS 962.96) TaxID=1314807 RepID=A0A4S8KKV0_DENBC|nr:hypothetical protein K435DRAFT_190822 [Dendrothele bispora CBS 962.96]
MVTVSSMISAYNSWDIDAILSSSWRSSTCIQQILPLSLGRPSMDNTQYRQYLNDFMSAFHNFTFTAKDIIVDEKERKVSLWGNTSAQTDIGPYKNEIVLIIKCDEDGKAVWIGEFVDSHYSVVFFPKLREYAAGKSKSS